MTKKQQYILSIFFLLITIAFLSFSIILTVQQNYKYQQQQKLQHKITEETTGTADWEYKWYNTKLLTLESQVWELSEENKVLNEQVEIYKDMATTEHRKANEAIIELQKMANAPPVIVYVPAPSVDTSN